MEEVDRIKKKMMEEIMARSKKENGWPEAPVHVGDSNFKDFVSNYDVAVIDCWAPWCGPCRVIGPVIEELSKELKGKVAFGKLNTDDNQRTAMSYNIYAIPTLLVFKSGQMVDQIVGAFPKEQIKQRIRPYL